MSAFFRWDARPKRRTRVGDRRTVRRFLWWPTVIGGDARWLGVESVDQEAYMGWICPPEMKPYQGIKWRDIAWRDDDVRYVLTDAGRKHLEGK